MVVQQSKRPITHSTLTQPHDSTCQIHPIRRKSNYVPFPDPRKAQLQAARARVANNIKARSIPPPPPTQANSNQTPQPNDDYTTRTLIRIRRQLDRLINMLGKERNPSKCNQLAAGIDRLADIEQRLAMRPSPGTLKPKEETPSNGFTGLLD